MPSIGSVADRGLDIIGRWATFYQIFPFFDTLSLIVEERRSPLMVECTEIKLKKSKKYACFFYFL